MTDNLWNCFCMNHITCLLNLFMWRFFGGAEYDLKFSIFVITYFSVVLFCILLKYILDQFDISNGTQALDHHMRDYKVGLGYITFGSLFSFLSISVFEIDSTISSLCFYACSSFPSILLSVLINPSLERSNVYSTRLNLVAYNTKIDSVASLIFTLLLICFKNPNMFSNQSTYLLQQVAWVLANCPYYIEFYEVMTHRVNLILIGNENQVATRNYLERVNLMLVAYENQLATHNYQGAILDDSNSPDELDEPDEQQPIVPTEIVISSEDLQCNVCLLQFSERRVPLVLTKCGHSLCRKCCKAAQQQFPLSRFINCPFCRTQTPGPISELPKNYAIMGIVQKIGRVE